MNLPLPRHLELVVHQTHDKVQHFMRQQREQAVRLKQQTRRHVTAHPLGDVALVFALGVLVGRWLFSQKH